MAQPAKAFDHVDYPAVAQVGNILLEGQSQYQNATGLAPKPLVEPVADPCAHGIVCVAPGQNDMWLMPQLLGAVSEIVGVDTDAVSSHQAGLEREKVPLRARRVEHIPDRQIKLGKDLGQLIHERDVDVPLRVLDDLCRLCSLDGGGAEDLPAVDRPVHFGKKIQRLLVFSGNDLGDRLDSVNRIPGVNPFRTVSQAKMRAAMKTGDPFELRPADVVCHTGIDGALVDNDRGTLLFEKAAHSASGAQKRGKVRTVGTVHGSRNRDDVDVSRACVGRRVGQTKR